MRTNAKKDGSDWILNGNKVLSHKSKTEHVMASEHQFEIVSISPLQVFITNGWMADLVLVVAVTNREAKSPAHGISIFLVENGMKGFQKGRKLEKIGLKAQVLELFPSVSSHPSKRWMSGRCESSHLFLFSFFQRTQLNCFSRMCGSQLAPSWGNPTRDSTT